MRTYVILGLRLGLGLLLSATFVQAQTFVFPEKGQSPEQQELDDFTCFKWAKQQTGYDPEHPNLAEAPPTPSGGGGLRGAMGGAALGAVGGAIAGDAGKGAAIGAAAGGGMGMMRQRRAERGYQEEVQQASAKNQQTRATFDRAHNVCMEGKGYKIG
ncbi:glycine zipper domain-containing protein [uncultured Nitrospira sp.]|uniref:glycine zipper domain-containing protein n=1 Tax=uncultured Nitrospira sp. TaxID=157176 RepID=UPI0031400C89